MEFCGPCKFRNIDAKADVFCRTCQEPQCIKCADVHKSSKATRTHLLTYKTDLNEDSKIVKDLDKFQRCRDHSEKPLEFFCADHSHLMCSTCLLNGQKSDCKSVVDITTVGKFLVENVAPKIDQDLDNIIDKCKRDEAKIADTKRSCEKEEKDLTKYLADTRDKILTIFDKYEKRVKSEISKNVEQQISTLDELESKSTETRKTVEINKEMLETLTTSGSVADVFRCALSITEQLDELNVSSSNAITKVKKQSLIIAPTLTHFTEDRLPLIQCETEENVLDIHSEHKPVTSRAMFLYTIKRLVAPTENEVGSDEIPASTESMETPDNSFVYFEENTEEIIQTKQDINGSNPIADTDVKHGTLSNESCIHVTPVCDVIIPTPDGKSPVVEGMATLHDGRLILSDMKWSRLIILNENFTYNSQLALTKQPGNMAVLDHTWLAVCLQSVSKIALISIQRELKWAKNISTKYHPKCISTIDKSRMLVAMRDGFGCWYMFIYSKEGLVLREIKTVSSEFDALHISSFIPKESEVDRYFLQCSKKSNALLCFTADGKVVFSYSVMSPIGICTDFARYIYILESNSMLHILSMGGKLIQKTNLNFSTNLNDLAINTEMDRLFVIQNKCKCIRALSIALK